MYMNENKKTIWLFSLGAFLNDLGYYAVITIWPIFVTSVIGASVTFLGFIDGLGDAFVSLSQASSGFLSDKLRKRKVFIWLGYFLAFISRIVYAVSYQSWQLILGKILDRAGKMRDAPRDAIVADITPREKRASAFGILRAADRGGAVFGLLASILLVGYFSYRQMFFLAAIPSLVGSFQMLIGLIALLASLIAGILWDGIGLKAPFVLSLALTFIALLLLFFVREPKNI